MANSTLVMLTGLFFAAVLTLSTSDVDAVFARPAPVIGLSIVLAIALEARAGLRNLLRIDLFMLVALYLLTFLEFLFDQDTLSDRITTEGAQTAALATILGYAGIVVGRHAFPPVRPLSMFANVSLSPQKTVWLLVGCFFFGHLYMFLAVNFDIFEVVHQLSRPRFSQPWTRGRYGSLSTLLNEVGLLSYLVPPLAGAVFAQAKRYSIPQKIIALLTLIFAFYEGFAGGTRNVFLTHLVTCAATYALLLPRLTIGQLLKIAVPIIVIGGFSIYYMAEIRTVGLQRFDLEAARTTTLFVDMNLVNIAILTEVFPERASYLGLEVPYITLIRPIPRAFWPSKPEGLSLSIEEAVGVGSSITLSATFVGELWIAGGYIAVGIAALSFGAAAAAWNRVGAKAQSNLYLILFASGFFPAGLLMRGFLSLMPTLLPVIALAVYLKTRKGSHRRRNFR